MLNCLLGEKYATENLNKTDMDMECDPKYLITWVLSSAFPSAVFCLLNFEQTPKGCLYPIIYTDSNILSAYKQRGNTGAPVKCRAMRRTPCYCCMRNNVFDMPFISKHLDAHTHTVMMLALAIRQRESLIERLR